MYQEYNDGEPGYDNEPEFWDIIVHGMSHHDLFMYGYLSDNLPMKKSVAERINEYGSNDNHSVKVWDTEWDFPEPPEFLL